MKTNKWSIQKLIQVASTYDSVLDIGCGNGTLIKKIRAERKLGIDACLKAIKDAGKSTKVNTSFMCRDLANLDSMVEPKSFDCVIGVDIIEHFVKEDAIKLIKMCEDIATKRIVFFIPVGNHPQTSDDRGYNNHHFQTHRSTWYPEDMEKLCYEVFHYPDWHKNIKSPKEKGAMWCQKILE